MNKDIPHLLRANLTEMRGPSANQILSTMRKGEYLDLSNQKHKTKLSKFTKKETDEYLYYGKIPERFKK